MRRDDINVQEGQQLGLMSLPGRIGDEHTRVVQCYSPGRLRELKMSKCLGFRVCLKSPALFHLALSLGSVTWV